MFRGIHSEEERAKIRALPWHLVHGSLTSIFFLWSISGSVFVLFMNELGMPKGLIGVILSFLPFSGVIALFFAPYATRIGRKKVFIGFFGSRYFVIINLLWLPVILERFGRNLAFGFVVLIILAVAVLRALGETAYYPWTQEFIPNSVRGRYSAIFNLAGTFASAAALLIAGRVIGSGSGLGRYLWLIGAGTVIGLIGIVVMRWVPGGAPQEPEGGTKEHTARMAEALRDANYRYYLKGMGGVMLGSALLTSFLSLYLKEQMGLDSGTVVVLDMVVMIGGALTSVFWGWAADRSGSRPILISALVLCLLVPLGWLLLPRHLPMAALWCGLLYFVYGVIANGSSIGAGRLLFNGVIPPEKSTSYSAIYYAWMGLSGGTAPLLAGWILSLSAGWQGRIGWLVFDGYSLLFALSLAALSFGLAQYRQVRPDGVYTTRALIRKMLAGISTRKV